MALNFLNNGYFAGKVGIGTDSPNVRAEIKASVNGNPVTSGQTQTNGALRVRGSATNVLDIGQQSASPYGMWMQVCEATSLGVNYPLLLNPNGGKVGIGNNTPLARLTIGSSQGSSLDFSYDSSNGYRNNISNYWNSSADTRIDFNIGRTANVAPVTVMSVGYNSNVGIGTTSPGYKLEVSDANTYVGIKNTLAGSTASPSWSGLTFAQSSGAVGASIQSGDQLNSNSNNDLRFLTRATGGGSASEIVRFTGGGNVGIGRSSSITARLFVEGPVDTATISTSSTPAARINNGGAISNWIGSNGYNYGYIQSIQDDGSNNLKHLSLQPLGGNVGIGTTNPGYTLEIAGPSTTSFAYQRTGVSANKWGFHSDNDATYWQNLTSGNLLFTLQNGGNVGIGTTSPSAKLDVQITTSNRTTLEPVLSVSAEGNGPYTGFGPKISFDSNIYYGAATGNPAGIIETAYIGAVMGTTYATNSDLVFATRDGATSVTEKIRILGNGNVGIGTTNPLRKLDLIADLSTDAVRIKNTNSNGGGLSVFAANGGGGTNRILTLGDSSENIKVAVIENGNVGIGTTTPTNLLTINDPNANGTITDTIPSWWGLVIDRAYTTSSSAGIGIIGGTVATGSSGRLYLGNSDDVDSIYIDGGANQMHFAVGGSERMRITSAGGISFGSTGTAYGTTGQILKSNANASPTWVDASTVIGGPYLPLTAGSSYPLTGILYLGNVGTDQKIQFQRTGGNVYSIEHDSAQLYFYNRTTTESPLIIQNDGDVLMNAGNVGIGTTSPGEKLDVAGNIKIQAALLSNQENTDIDSAAAEMVAQVAIATYTAAFFDFVVKKSTNVRSGTVYACHDGTNVEFTETSTQDLGDTSDVTLSVDISGGNMRLMATVTSDDWSVKSLIRAI